MKCEFKPEPFSDELFMCYIPGSVIPIYLPGHHPAKERVEWVQTTEKKKKHFRRLCLIELRYLFFVFFSLENYQMMERNGNGNASN